jgi:hypothetical protein
VLAGYYRCPGASATDIVTCGGSNDGKRWDDVTISGTTTTTESGCSKVTFPRCTRLTVQLTDAANSGPQNLLEVGHSLVSLAGFTNDGSDRATANDIKSSVTKDVDLVVGSASVEWGYTVADTNMATGGTLVAAVASTTVSVTGATTKTGRTFPAGSTITLTCDGKSKGDFTVATRIDAASAAFVVTLSHAVADHHSSCAIGKSVVVQGKTSFISVTADLSEYPVNPALASLGLHLLGQHGHDYQDCGHHRPRRPHGTRLRYWGSGTVIDEAHSVVSIACACNDVGHYVVSTGVTSTTGSALALVLKSAVKDLNGYCAVGASAASTAHSTEVKSTISSVTWTWPLSSFCC